MKITGKSVSSLPPPLNTPSSLKPIKKNKSF
jgi:hypothetical protein